MTARPKAIRRHHKQNYTYKYITVDGHPTFCMTLTSKSIKYTVYVNLEDVEVVRPYNWHILRSKKKVYIGRWKNPDDDQSLPRLILLHRAIIGHQNIPDGCEVDHLNGNPQDNRRSNLRVLTGHQHAVIARSSKERDFYKGVYPLQSGGKTYYNVVVRDVRYGYITKSFKSAFQAALYYDKIRSKWSGDELLPEMLNFPNRKAITQQQQ